MYCEKCGSDIKNDAEFCPHCGAKGTATQKPKDIVPIVKTDTHTNDYQQSDTYAQTFVQNPTKNRVWFAPVSVILSAILVFGAKLLIDNLIIPNFQSSEGYYSGTGDTISATQF